MTIALYIFYQRNRLPSHNPHIHFLLPRTRSATHVHRWSFYQTGIPTTAITFMAHSPRQKQQDPKQGLHPNPNLSCHQCCRITSKHALTHTQKKTERNWTLPSVPVCAHSSSFKPKVRCVHRKSEQLHFSPRWLNLPTEMYSNGFSSSPVLQQQKENWRLKQDKSKTKVACRKNLWLLLKKEGSGRTGFTVSFACGSHSSMQKPQNHAKARMFILVH